MIVALIDNGSLEPAAQLNLRAVAAALSQRAGVRVAAASWKHSDRIDVAELDGAPAWTLAKFVRTQVADGERDFVFVPFFISAQGAIGSALRDDLDTLQRELGEFTITFTSGLASDRTLAAIVSARIRELLTPAARMAFVSPPPVIVVDHGGPSAASAAIRDEVTERVRAELGAEVRAVAAASLEGEDYAHNLPLFAQQLAAPGFDSGDVIVAPLFLAPGRHAGPRGDLVQLARAAEQRPGALPLRCHFTGLVGTHPLAVDRLAAALHETLSTFHASSSA